MRIIGHGIDLVEVARIAAVLNRHGDRFLTRVFTRAESDHSAGRRRRAEHLAGRFAAKEAALKALGTGLANGITWTELEVVPDAAGRPTLALSGEALKLAGSLGVTAWQLSMTHTGEYAAASVIALG